MPVKKHSVEQIIAKLREIEKLTAQGMSVPMAARKVGVTDQTFYRWRLRYGLPIRRERVAVDDLPAL